MILGTGVDIVEVARVDRLLEKHSPRFEEKIFTPDEILYCRSKAEPGIHFAARFAAKEAVMKCLGTGMDKGIAFSDIEVSGEDCDVSVYAYFGVQWLLEDTDNASS